ncbi:MAG: hypothetical protein ACC644_01815 [Candidatus Hydrothermarchaeales archaeon]
MLYHTVELSQTADETAETMGISVKRVQRISRMVEKNMHKRAMPTIVKLPE